MNRRAICRAWAMLMTLLMLVSSLPVSAEASNVSAGELSVLAEGSTLPAGDLPVVLEEDALILEDGAVPEIDGEAQGLLPLNPGEFQQEEAPSAGGIVGNRVFICSSWRKLHEAVLQANTGDTIVINGDIKQEKFLKPLTGKAVTLVLQDRLSGKSGLNMFILSSGAGMEMHGVGPITNCNIAVEVSDDCFFTLRESNITRSIRIAVKNKGYFTMEGGKISDGEWYGVYNNGSFAMTDGEITGNADYGVFNQFGAFTMTRGKIQNNGCGVETNKAVSTVITVSGYVTITGNKNADVLVRQGQVIAVGGKLDENAQIGVTLDEGNLPGPGGPVVVTKGLAGNGTADNFIVWGDYEKAINADGELEIRARPSDDLPIAPDMTLLAKLTTCGKKALKLSWTAAEGAQGYDVYFAKCGSAMKKKSVTKGNSVTFKDLKKGETYRACVKAWTEEGGSRTYIGEASPIVYAIAGGYNDKVCNPGSVAVKKDALSLKVGKTARIKATVKGVKHGRKALKKTKLLRYYSTNGNVAKVNASGKVTGVGIGNCKIYAMANNGMRKSVKVTVK